MSICFVGVTMSIAVALAMEGHNAKLWIVVIGWETSVVVTIYGFTVGPFAKLL